MRLVDTQFLETPWYGSRQMARHLRRKGYVVGRKRVRRPMAKMGLAPIYQRPRTTVPHPEHRIYPYLLRDLTIDRPNQVWCADLTYIPMRRGFLYLVAVMDWTARKVLSWRVSNTMDVEFCIEALEEALKRFGRPEIFNTAQGSQFTSPRFTGVLQEAGVRISMDERGRWMDNVFIERLWRSLKSRVASKASRLSLLSLPTVALAALACRLTEERSSAVAPLPVTLLSQTAQPAASLLRVATSVRHIQPCIGPCQMPDPVPVPGKKPVAKPAGS